MALVSASYLLFLIVLLLLFYQIEQNKTRLHLLLAASLFFIAQYNLFSVFFLLATAFFTWYIGNILSSRKSKIILWSSILLHVFVLLGIKYLNLGKSLINFDSLHFQTEAIIIALGVSYYTLQNISYIFETYSNRLEPTKDISNFLLYQAFFPKLTSGPIEMPKAFFKQLNKPAVSFSWQNVNYGFQRILLGFFKKMVLADRLAPIVANIYTQDTSAEGFTLWFGICLFTLLLYFDFSAYMDIAIGSARLFGIRLSENFNYPLRTTSISAFWRTWHITLIQWLTQYLYYPIVYTFRRNPTFAILLAITVVFTLSGLWHGWGLTYIVWVACHVMYLSFETLTKKQRNGLSKKITPWLYTPFSILITFNLVCFAHLFFRSDSLTTAYTLLQKVFVMPFFPSDLRANFLASLAHGGSQEDIFNILFTFLFCGLFLATEKKICTYYQSEKFRFIATFLLLLIIFVFGIFNAGEAFIYLQF